MPTTRIRPFADTDCDHALALNNLNVPHVNELDRAEVLRLAGLAASALVAEIDGAFAGFCWVLGPGQPYASLNYRWFSAHYDDFVYLDRIAVHDHLRRYGVGRALYGTLIEQFSGRCPVLLCEVNVRPPNEASLRFHERLGFREVGQQETDGGAKTVSLLELPLPVRQ